MQQANNNEENVKKKSMGREILEWIITILGALVIALLIKNFIFQFAVVRGPSMNPTLENGDRLFVWELFYQPKRGDIVILQLPDREPYVKRVIAVEGDEVDINYITHEVSVNGEVLEEDYILEPTALQGNVEFPITIKKDHVFVLGDNRNNSEDGRMFGQIPNDYLIGKATFRIMPFNRFGSIY